MFVRLGDGITYAAMFTAMVCFLLCRCPWVKVNGVLYREGFVVVRDVHEDLPTFGRITKIICLDAKEVFFYLQCLQTNGLNQHLNAYSVEPDLLTDKVLIPQNRLIFHEPVQELPFEGGYFVILRRSMQAWMD